MKRLLEIGEVIKKGDEFWVENDDSWHESGYAGNKITDIDGPYRREIQGWISVNDSLPECCEIWGLGKISKKLLCKITGEGWVCGYFYEDDLAGRWLTDTYRGLHGVASYREIDL